MKVMKTLGRKCLVFIMIFSVFLAPVSTYALSEKTVRRYSQYQVYFYDPCAARNSTTGDDGTPNDGVFIEASDNATTIMSNLLEAGYTKEAAAAILGNLQAESGLEPRKFEGGALAGDGFRAYDGGRKTFNGGFGLAQWTTDGRVANLQKYADDHTLPVISLEAQVGFLIKELADYGYGPGVLNNYGLDEAVFVIAKNYEAPGAMIWIDHEDSNGNIIHYNDRIPKTFSELSPTETKGAYNTWLTRYNYALFFLGLEPMSPPEEIIEDLPYDETTGNCETGDEGSGSDRGPEEPTIFDINNIISYWQCDPRWRDYNYGNEGVNGSDMNSICDSGCGPTSFASILATMGKMNGGRLVNPIDTADLAGKAGMHVKDNGSSHAITKFLASKYGLEYMDVNHKSIASINNALNSGYMVHIVGAGSMPFTSGGHYVAIMGIDSSGNWVVADPGHKSALIAKYPPSVIVSGASAAGAVK